MSICHILVSTCLGALRSAGGAFHPCCSVICLNSEDAQFFSPAVQVKACLPAHQCKQRGLGTVKLALSAVYFGLKHIWAVL